MSEQNEPPNEDRTLLAVHATLVMAWQNLPEPRDPLDFIQSVFVAAATLAGDIGVDAPLSLATTLAMVEPSRARAEDMLANGYRAAGEQGVHPRRDEVH